jgi:hypothetical protein
MRDAFDDGRWRDDDKPRPNQWQFQYNTVDYEDQHRSGSLVASLGAVCVHWNRRRRINTLPGMGASHCLWCFVHRHVPSQHSITNSNARSIR